MTHPWPTLDITFPRALKALHQLELTSRCNLKCVYCVSPDIVKGVYPDRRAEDMTRETFMRALEWVGFFVRRGTQHELNLAGIGESYLHPEFEDFVRIARGTVGPDVKIVLATNGLLVTEENSARLAKWDPEISVSGHVPAKAAMADHILRKHGIKGGKTLDGFGYANDWAGQVDVPWKQDYKFPCQWMRDAKAFVMSDGKISSCCLDASGAGVIGHVRDPIGSVMTRPYSLCKGCYQEISAKGYDQRA